MCELVIVRGLLRHDVPLRPNDRLDGEVIVVTGAQHLRAVGRSHDLDGTLGQEGHNRCRGE